MCDSEIMITDIIKKGFLDLSEDEVIGEVRAQMADGVPSESILLECQDGITSVGDAFGEGRMFVSDLMISASIFKKAVGIMMPDRDLSAFTGNKGKVVIGTVKEDFHNIGKDLTSNLLKASGYDVIDIGVDCSPEDFVKATKESGAKIVALSCLLTSSYPFIIKTIEALKSSGLRRKVKVIVGGAPLDEKAADYCGADAYGANARSAVSFAQKIYS
jgi:methylmalonyl-CoA mutase cobalamin-binding domain/chain